MIKPTIGQVVWYWKNIDEQQKEGAQPFAALVTFVHSDELVNLATFDRNGDTYPVVGVPLFQGEGERPSGKHCEWMPYQKGQAAKQEATAPTNIGAGLEFGEFKDRIAAVEAELKSIRQVAEYIKQLPDQGIVANNLVPVVPLATDGVHSGEKHVVTAPLPPPPPAKS